jgi:NCS1 family nucleobase:cation symporter-1
VALLVGIFIAIGGSYTPAGSSGPFPPDGIIGILKSPFPFADYAWVVGLVVSFLLYGILTKLLPNKEVEAAAVTAGQPA